MIEFERPENAIIYNIKIYNIKVFGNGWSRWIGGSLWL